MMLPQQALVCFSTFGLLDSHRFGAGGVMEHGS